MLDDVVVVDRGRSCETPLAAIASLRSPCAAGRRAARRTTPTGSTARRLGRGGRHVRRRRPDHPRHLPAPRRRPARARGAADLRERQHRPQRRQRGRGPGRQHAPAGRVPVRQGRRQPALRQGRAPARPGSARTRQRPADVGSAVYTAGAKAAVRFLAGQPGTDKARHLGLRAGGGHRPRHGAGRRHRPRRAEGPLARPVPAAARPLPRHHHRPGARRRDVQPGQDRQQATSLAWPRRRPRPAPRARRPRKLPEGLGAILNPGNVKAVVEADAIDPLALAARVPAGTPVLLDVFGLRRPGRLRRRAAADRRAGPHRADRRRAQGRQPRAARRPDRQRRQLRQAGPAVAAAGHARWTASSASRPD